MQVEVRRQRHDGVEQHLAGTRELVGHVGSSPGRGVRWDAPESGSVGVSEPTGYAGVDRSHAWSRRSLTSTSSTPCGVATTGLRSASTSSGTSTASRPSATIRSTRACSSTGSLPRYPASSGPDPQRAQGSCCVLGGDRGEQQAAVVPDLRGGAARGHHDQRAETGIADHPERDLDAVRHRLHEHLDLGVADLGARSPPPRTGPARGRGGPHGPAHAPSCGRRADRRS